MDFVPGFACFDGSIPRMHSLIDLVTTLNSPAITAGHGGFCSSRGTDDFIVILRGPDYATAEHGPTVGLEGLLDGSRAGPRSFPCRCTAWGRRYRTPPSPMIE